LAFVEYLEFGPHAELVHLGQNPAHDRKAILEDLVAEVDASARERRHLGTKLQNARALVRRHADCAAG
jgi:predicted ATP-dependent protease